MVAMAVLHLSKFTSITFLSSPETANTCREELEQMLVYYKKIEIDFSNVHVTQGFVHQFLDPVFEKRGKLLFERLFFANCSESVEVTINNVIKQYRETGLSIN